MPSNHLILCCPLLLLPSIFPSIRVFSNESALCIRWPKYWIFSFSISPSNEYSGLISFKIDWFPCCPRTSQESSPTPQFKSISSSALTFLCGPTLTSVHDYWKNYSFVYVNLCWQSNVSAFNMLSRLVIGFLWRSKSLLFLAAVTICSGFGAPEKQSATVFHCFPIYLPWSDGTRCHGLSFLNVEF